LKERAEASLGQVLWEFYGATETGINTVLRPEDQLRKPGSCGTAVPGQEIHLAAPDGTEVADGLPGEFMVRNTWLAEYYNRPDATGKSLHDGYFSVGDIAVPSGADSLETGWELALTRAGAAAGYGAYTVVFNQDGFDTANSTIVAEVSPLQTHSS